jgi:hypothetical protein
MLDPAAKPLELVRENALGLLLRQAQVEGERTVETVELDGCDPAAAREQLNAANDPPALKERVRQAQALENLERARFHDDRAVPTERFRPSVHEMTGHAAPGELDRENEPGRTGADDENGVLRRHGRSRGS